MSDTITSLARVSADPSILQSVKDEACSLAIWEREAENWMERLLDGEPRDVRLNTLLDELRSGLAEALLSSGFANSHLHSRLIDKIAELADLYCSILGLDELEVRVEVVTTNSCRKWHADYVKARLIATYVGDGTQWLDADDVDRVREGGEPQRINQLRTGDIGIFKGKLATDRPAIHRSPPIAGTGQKRLLLVLNPIEEN